ncbi:MAG: energy transducer TonB [Bacteroidales bacterium]|nr:energy transducer TonB [Bacteroidales bacterium]
MAEQYLKERESQERKSRVTGVALTVSLHLVLLVCCFLTGFTYLDPPPPEQEQILIEFDEPEIQKPRQTWNGTRPRAVEPDPTKDINLVQRSEALNEGTKSNEAPEATVDDFGDVDVPEPERKKEINRKALFAAADNKTQKDTLAAQTAREVSDALKAGHASGNTKTGETSGEPNAKLAGRSVNGTLPRPSYSVQASGKVVVDIWVDNYGQVQKAVAGADGTTVTDKTLWQAARKAALGAHFNMSADAPALQKGTITYIFKLN